MKQPAIEIKDLALYRDSRCILDIGELTVRQGELIAIVGPNGAGKSTLLQVANLLLPYQQGELMLFGKKASKVNALATRRRCAMVLQEALLLQATVFANVALGLKFRGYTGKKASEKVMAALKMFQCSHLVERPATALSGGEVQRVCLARAFVTEPELLYLDEPFASLDFATRTALLTELRQLARERSITVLLVSHQFPDILYFADRAVVLESGRVVQDDTPEKVLRQPVNKTVAALVGMDNIFDCQLSAGTNGSVVSFGNGIAFTLHSYVTKEAKAFCLPGDAIVLWDEGLSYQHIPWVVLAGTVEQIIPGIGVNQVVVTAHGVKFTSLVPRDQMTNRVALGKKIKIAFNPEEIHFI